MSVHSSQKKRRRDGYRARFQALGNHDKFMDRIMKTMYYGKMPLLERFSLPVTELAVEIYTEATARKTLDRLRVEKASELSRSACMSPCSFVLALLYLERLKTGNPSYVEGVSPSELFLVSMMVATKFLNDSGEEDDVMNSEWACSIDLPLKDVNGLEKDFLSAIDWNVYVDSHHFWTKLRHLERRIATKEGMKRGWFSYTDLDILLDYVNCIALAQSVVTVSAVCLASYIAGMLTVIGSTIVATQVATACCSSLYKMASLAPSSLTPEITSSPYPLLSDNGTLEDCDVAVNPPDLWSELTSVDLLSNKSQTIVDEVLREFRGFGSPFGITDVEIRLTYFMKPLFRQLGTRSSSPMIPNR